MLKDKTCEWEECWTGDYIFENGWQSFRTKKDRSLELKSVFHEYAPGRRKIAVKMVDIFGNDTMIFVDVTEMIETKQRKRLGKIETPAKKKNEDK